jgi:hypothetical protein
MRVEFGGTWIADSQDVTLLHDPGTPTRVDSFRMVFHSVVQQGAVG